VGKLVGRIVDTLQAREREGKSYGRGRLAEGLAEFPAPGRDPGSAFSQSAYEHLKPDASATSPSRS